MTIHTHRPTSSDAFTLVELLVVMTIAVVLLSLGASVANSVMKRSKATKCLATLRQIGTATQLYAADHNGRLPNTGHIRAEDGSSLSWLNTLSDYLGPDFIGRCPANPEATSTVAYGWNDLLTETSGATSTDASLPWTWKEAMR